MTRLKRSATADIVSKVTIQQKPSGRETASRRPGTVVADNVVVSAHTAQALRAIGVTRRWRAGAVVINRGQSSTAAFLLLQGRLRVSVPTLDGQEQLLRWLVPGEISGLSSVIAGLPYPADILAATDSEVLLIGRPRLVALLQAQPTVAFELLRVLGVRINQLIDALADQSIRSLPQRVEAALTRVAQSNGEPAEEGWRLHVTQEDIARAAGASRQKVNIHLQRLQAQGRLRLGYRSVVVLHADDPILRSV